MRDLKDVGSLRLWCEAIWSGKNLMTFLGNFGTFFSH